MIGKKVTIKRGLQDDCYSYVIWAIWRAVQSYDKEKSNGKSLNNWVLKHIDSAIIDFLRTLYAKKNRQLVFKDHALMENSAGDSFPITDKSDNPDDEKYDLDSPDVVQQNYSSKVEKAEERDKKEIIDQERKAAEKIEDETERAARLAEIKSWAVDLGLEVDITHDKEQEYELQAQEEIRDAVVDQLILEEEKRERREKNKKRKKAYHKKKAWRKEDIVPDYQRDPTLDSKELYGPIVEDLKEHLDWLELQIVNGLLRGETQTEIAEKLGYIGSSYINRRFKKIKEKIARLVREGKLELGIKNEWLTNSISEGQDKSH
jgi:hypothetical protein